MAKDIYPPFARVILTQTWKYLNPRVGVHAPIETGLPVGEIPLDWLANGFDLSPYQVVVMGMNYLEIVPQGRPVGIVASSEGVAVYGSRQIGRLEFTYALSVDEAEELQPGSTLAVDLDKLYLYGKSVVREAAINDLLMVMLDRAGTDAIELQQNDSYALEITEVVLAEGDADLHLGSLDRDG